MTYFYPASIDITYIRDICDAVRIIETSFGVIHSGMLHCIDSHVSISSSSDGNIATAASLSEEDGMDIYRSVSQQSGPVLRLLQSLLSLLTRNSNSNHSASSSTNGYPILPSTFLLLFPVMRGLLLLPHTMPGSEHTFYLLDR